MPGGYENSTMISIWNKVYCWNPLELEREYYYSEYGEEYDEGDPDYYDDEFEDGYEDLGKYNVQLMAVIGLV